METGRNVYRGKWGMREGETDEGTQRLGVVEFESWDLRLTHECVTLNL